MGKTYYLIVSQAGLSVSEVFATRKKAIEKLKGHDPDCTILHDSGKIELKSPIVNRAVYSKAKHMLGIACADVVVFAEKRFSRSDPDCTELKTVCQDNDIGLMIITIE